VIQNEVSVHHIPLLIIYGLNTFFILIFIVFVEPPTLQEVLQHYCLQRLQPEVKEED